jgi:Ran GTPase-activating protein (RanGAP) involved in mRNA processing and transport
MCIDLLDSKTQRLQEIDFSANLLGNLFCEHLAEYLKLNKDIRKVDISCNFVEESNAAILKDSLESNKNIIKVDIRNNLMNEGTVEEINEIVMKNFLIY